MKKNIVIGVLVIGIVLILITQNMGIVRLFNLGSNKMVELISTDNFNHTNSDGCDFRCRVKREGMSGWIGENLYYGPCDLRIAMQMWEQSPTHKAILDSEYKVGLVIVYPEGDWCYIVMNVKN